MFTPRRLQSFAPAFLTFVCAGVHAAAPVSAPGLQPDNVNVVNTPAVTVTNTPGVSVVNTPTVNVATLPAVNIASMPNLPDAENPARNAFQMALCAFGDATYCNGAPSQFNVPSDRRLVIELISGLCSPLGSDYHITLGLTTVVNGSQATHTFVPLPGPTANGVRFSWFNQLTRVYAGAGSVVSLGGSVATSDGIRGCRVSVSGYTVPL